VNAGQLRRVLPDWCLPEAPAWAVYPGRKLVPPKTRAFVDMLKAALARCDMARIPPSNLTQETP